MIHLLTLFIVVFPTSIDALLPGFYCGDENCYDVLNVNRDSSKSEIAKSYRKLAGKYHPDRNRGSPEETAKAEERFKIVAVAYETLKDEDSRRDYDYMLDNPDEVYRHYYYYYRHRVAPKVDVRLVILATILIISAIQYISAWQKYREAISYLFTQPKYRIKASEIAKERGLLPLKENAKKGKRRQVDKQEAKEEEDAIIKAIIEENIDMKGGYSKPDPMDLLVVQIVIFPYTTFLYVKWYLRWIWKFNIKREEFGIAEKHFIIRKNMSLSESQFQCLEESEIENFVDEELWIKENFDRWKKNKEERERAALAENAQHKRYRRFMKNRGPGQITFLDD